MNFAKWIIEMDKYLTKRYGNYFAMTISNGGSPEFDFIYECSGDVTGNETENSLDYWFGRIKSRADDDAVVRAFFEAYLDWYEGGYFDEIEEMNEDDNA